MSGTDAPRRGPVTSHPLYCEVMHNFETHIATRLPYCFFIEEVPGFAKPVAKLGGKTPLQVLVAQMKPYGYSLKALLLHHTTFVNVNRTRVWLWGVHKDAGGEKGCSFINHTIRKAIYHIERNTTPLKLMQLVDVRGSEEVTRRRASEDRVIYYACFTSNVDADRKCKMSNALIFQIEYIGRLRPLPPAPQPNPSAQPFCPAPQPTLWATVAPSV